MIQTKRALQRAWLALIAITLASFAIAASSGIGGQVETALIIAAAAVKGRAILVWFMGARSFPTPWRVFFDAWLLVNASVIIGFHLVAHG